MVSRTGTELTDASLQRIEALKSRKDTKTTDASLKRIAARQEERARQLKPAQDHLNARPATPLGSAVWSIPSHESSRFASGFWFLTTT